MNKFKKIIGERKNSSINYITINNIEVMAYYYYDNTTYIRFALNKKALLYYTITINNLIVHRFGSNYDDEILAIQTKDDLEKFCNKLLKEEIFK